MPTSRTRRTAAVASSTSQQTDFFSTLSWDGEPVAPPAPTVPTGEEPVIAAEPQATELFPIYAVVVTDGLMPEGSNLLHISMQFSPELTWSRNILPQQSRSVRTSSRLTAAQVREYAIGAVTMPQAMRELKDWLSRFEGDRVLVCSSVAFWHILHHMAQSVSERGLPFRMTPIDVESFCAGAAGSLKTTTKLRFTSPAKALAERIATVEKAANEGGGFKLDW